MRKFLKSNVNCLRNLKTAAVLYILICLMACHSMKEGDDLGETPAFDAVPLLSINEILFDPVGDGCDYVEIVNTAGYELDLSCFYLTNRNSKGELNTGKKMTSSAVILSPGAYCLITSDSARLARDYSLCPDSLCLIIKTLPSMPNDGGSVVVCEANGVLIDECSYNKDWHHTLIAQKEGIALEKVHPLMPSSVSASWASASMDAGFGTPGYENSQYRPVYDHLLGGFYVEKENFAPSSGTDDAQWYLFYRFNQSYVANICIYNREGIPVERLAENVLLGSRGFFVWQGATSGGEAYPCGRYLVDIVCYRLDGQVFKWKFVCTLQP